MNLFLTLLNIAICDTIVGTIPVMNGNVVLVSNCKGNFIFPKGRLKKHETPEEGAMRETKEESGCTGKIKQKIIYDKAGEDRIYFIMEVSHMKSDFDEAHDRELLVVKPTEAMKMKKVPDYVKDLIKHHILHTKFAK